MEPTSAYPDAGGSARKIASPESSKDQAARARKSRGPREITPRQKLTIVRLELGRRARIAAGEAVEALDRRSALRSMPALYAMVRDYERKDRLERRKANDRGAIGAS
jgi:hypothetical protein